MRINSKLLNFVFVICLLSVISLTTIQTEAVEITIPAGPAEAPVGTAIAEGDYSPVPEMTYTITPFAATLSPPNILLLHADDGNGEPIRTQLQAFGDLGTIDVFDARSGTPTLVELQAYDVVITWTNYVYQNPTGIGNVLADYVDNGGKVINMVFSMGTSGWQMAGRFMSEGYTAVNGTSTDYSTACLGAYDAGHPIMLGITNVCDYYRLNGTYLTTGSTAVAYWDDGDIFVGAKDNNTVVSITGYPGVYRAWTGQMDSVLHNAIIWVGDQLPDLIVSSLSAGIRTFGTPMVRGVFANYMVTNQGSDDAVSSCLDFYLSRDIVLDGGDVYLGRENIPGLTAGNSYSGFKDFRRSFDNWQPASGTWRVIADSDACDDNEESDETNNQTSTVAGIVVK